MSRLLAIAALIATSSVVLSSANLLAEPSPALSYDEFLSMAAKGAPATASERAKREGLFRAELDAVVAHNEMFRQGKVLYRRGLNSFSDMTPEEKSTRVMELGRSDAQKAAQQHSQPEPRVASKGGGHDWRMVIPPVLTPVKDQGNCGSCWAHGVMETVESTGAVKTGTLMTLSQQVAVSCAPSYNITIPALHGRQEFGGCGGYDPRHALAYIAQDSVLEGRSFQEWEVPYMSYWAQSRTDAYRPTPTCKSIMPTIRNSRIVAPFRLTGPVAVSPNNAKEIEEYLRTTGPVTISIYVVQSLFSYSGGIYSAPECDGGPQMIPSHVVQLVGYGHDDDLGQDYWVVRNSWSATWGEKGYIRMLKRDTEKCGMMFLPSPQDTTVYTLQKACGMCGLLADTVGAKLA